MLTLPMGIGVVLFGLCVLGFTVAVMIHDTWRLQLKAEEAAQEVADPQDSFPKAA